MKAHGKPFESEFNAALDRWHRGDPRGAVSALQVLAQRYPDEAAIHGMLGGYLYEQGALCEALPHTKRAVQLSPRSELAARWHFHVLYDLGLVVEALDELQRFRLATDQAELRNEWSGLIAQVEARAGKRA